MAGAPGFDDILLAYPSADRAATPSWPRTRNCRGAVTVMVDDAAQLDLIDAARARRPQIVRVCLELDTSLRMLGGRVRIGALRSPLHQPEQVAALARAVVPAARASGSWG